MNQHIDLDEMQRWAHNSLAPPPEYKHGVEYVNISTPEQAEDISRKMKADRKELLERQTWLLLDIALHVRDIWEALVETYQ